MPLDTRPWDTSEHLDSPEAIAAYLEAVMEENDPALLTNALGQIARARGMTQLAKEAGLSREVLYKAFVAGGNPTLDTLSKTIAALGLKLVVVPA
jgi:probable addiction module antidote protein